LDLSEKKFSIIKEISNAIIATEDAASIANLMLDLAITHTGAEKGSLMLVNGDELYIFAARGVDAGLARTYRERIGEGIAGTVAQNGTAVMVADIDSDDRFRGKKRDHYKTKSFVSCPVVSKKRLLGVININDKKDGSPFNHEELVLMETIANQAAVVLENWFLMNQLERKAAQLEEINRNLIDTDVVKTEFFMRISHELRTPLNSIRGSIYYLQQQEKASKSSRLEFYDIIAEETHKLIDLVENLLSFVRLESEEQTVRKSVIDLSDLFGEISASNILKTALERRNVAYSAEIPRGLSNIVGDKIKTFQLFINLIEGLSYYLISGDKIGVTVTEDEYVKVMLTMPKRLHPTPSDLFSSKILFRPEHTEERLKLYLARKVAEIHRWVLYAGEEADQVKVFLEIPKYAEQKVEAATNSSLDIFIELISELLDINICSIMLSDQLTGELAIRCARGLDNELVQRTRLRMGDRIAGWVALEGKPLFIKNIEDDSRFARPSIPQYSTKSLLSLPLRVQDKVVGVINLNNKRNSEPFNECDFDIASMLGERISRHIERIYSGEYAEDKVKEMLAALQDLLMSVKKYGRKKNVRLALVNMVMDALGAPEEEKKIALYVSLLYDLGLASIDESIMNKERLAASDRSLIRMHPRTAVALLDGFETSDMVKEAILHHHERFDGTGYPDGLKGASIPLVSRVIAVVDTYCAMTEERPYRKAIPPDESMREIAEQSGSRYDPQVVKALQNALVQKIAT